MAWIRNMLRSGLSSASHFNYAKGYQFYPSKKVDDFKIPQAGQEEYLFKKTKSLKVSELFSQFEHPPASKELSAAEVKRVAAFMQHATLLDQQIKRVEQLRKEYLAACAVWECEGGAPSPHSPEGKSFEWTCACLLSALRVIKLAEPTLWKQITAIDDRDKDKEGEFRKDKCKLVKPDKLDKLDKLDKCEEDSKALHRKSAYETHMRFATVLNPIVHNLKVVHVVHTNAHKAFEGGILHLRRYFLTIIIAITIFTITKMIRESYADCNASRALVTDANALLSKLQLAQSGGPRMGLVETMEAFERLAHDSQALHARMVARRVERERKLNTESTSSSYSAQIELLLHNSEALLYAAYDKVTAWQSETEIARNTAEADRIFETMRNLIALMPTVEPAK